MITGNAIGKVNGAETLFAFGGIPAHNYYLTGILNSLGYSDLAYSVIN